MPSSTHWLGPVGKMNKIAKKMLGIRGQVVSVGLAM